MAIPGVDGVQRTNHEVQVQRRKVEVTARVDTTVQENGAERLGASRFQGEQVRLRLNNQFDTQQQQPPPTIDDQISDLRRVRRNLPPEDQAQIDRSIRGLELTRDAADPAKVRQMAEDLVNDNGGADDFDHVGAGSDLAEIARLSPVAGQAVLDETLNIIGGDDRDEIAQDFVESMTDTELTTLARTPEGRQMLETAKHELEQGNVHYDEELTLDRIDAALTSATQTEDEAVDAAVERILESDSFLIDGEVLSSEIERLNSLFGNEAGGELMSRLYSEMPDELFASLRAMDNLSDPQKDLIGRALGQTFDGLSAEGKTQFAQSVAAWTEADGLPPAVNLGTEEIASFADLISRSFNTEMKTAVVNEMMARAENIDTGLFGADNGGGDVQALFAGAAMIADSAYGDSRTAMLETIIETLPKVNLPSLIKNTEVKDELSRLFMSAGEDLLHRVAPDGAFASQELQAGMIAFMELTLFSENPNSLRPELMEHMVRLTQDVGDASADPPVSQAEYEAAHGGWSQQDHVEVMSGLMAMAWKAADNQKEAIKASEEQRKQTVEMFTGLAFSFIPGAGDVLGELGGEGAEFLEQIAGKVRDFAWDQAQGALQSGVEGQLNDLLSGDSLGNIDTMLNELADVVLSLNASLPNGENGELDLRSKFQSAFAFYQLIQF